MSDSKIDAIVIPLSDPHNSEYMATHWQKLQWISGFTGSAGTVLITQDHAGLWSDGRYYLQGEQELTGTTIVLHKAGLKDNSTPLKWLKENLADGAVVAMTADMWSHHQIKVYSDQLSTHDIKVKTDVDLIGEIWTEDRPAIPLKSIFIHDVKYAGVDVADKVQQIRSEMMKHKADWHLVTTLDDIGWITNLRGYDVEFNPVFIAYLLIGQQESRLYIHTEKVDDHVSAYLAKAGITIHPYDEIYDHISRLTGSLLINPEDCNEAIYNCIGQANVVSGQTISRMLKAIKNEVEIGYIEQVMVKDGVALAHAFYWLEQHIDQEVVTEADFVDKIAYYRSQQEGYYGESFAAIVGYRGNGAIIHYRPQHGKSQHLKSEGVLLCDSGGQYLNGTTDITRTIAMGEVSEEAKHAFTCVLKGHIALDRIRFPEGTTGAQLDVLARQYLWQEGMNYGHGTGHGVGFFMNVHEPPQGYAPGTGSRATTALIPGMFSSNEPGYYKAGEYGIRIENLILVEQSEHEGFLMHRNMTLYPMDINMIDVDMLTATEVQWLNDYHALVADKLCPELDDHLAAWLKSKCVPL